MRTIKMTTGARVALDGDLLTMLETLYHELTAKRDLERTFEDTVREIQSAIEQMTDAERRQYLSESLFLNFVSYENERLGAYLKKLDKKGATSAAGGPGTREGRVAVSYQRSALRKGFSAVSRQPDS